MTDPSLDAISDEHGSCWDIVDGGTERVAGPHSLMREGWGPIRETPFVMDRNCFVYIFICPESA